MSKVLRCESAPFIDPSPSAKIRPADQVDHFFWQRFICASASCASLVYKKAVPDYGRRGQGSARYGRPSPRSYLLQRKLAALARRRQIGQGRHLYVQLVELLHCRGRKLGFHRPSSRFGCARTGFGPVAPVRCVAALAARGRAVDTAKRHAGALRS